VVRGVSGVGLRRWGWKGKGAEGPEEVRRTPRTPDPKQTLNRAAQSEALPQNPQTSDLVHGVRLGRVPLEPHDAELGLARALGVDVARVCGGARALMRVVFVGVDVGARE
jgi:hypothetical protein